MILILEGVVGAGKTTAIKRLEQELLTMGRQVKVCEEDYGPKFLNLFLSDMDKYAFAFQTTMVSKRKNVYREAAQYNSMGYDVLIDRCLIGDRIFAEVNFSDGRITPEEMQVYDELSDCAEAPGSVVRYLRVTPETSMERIAKRGRKGENSYDVKYITDLINRHDAVIPPESWVDWKGPCENIIAALKLEPYLTPVSKFELSHVLYPEESCDLSCCIGRRHKDREEKLRKLNESLTPD